MTRERFNFHKSIIDDWRNVQSENTLWNSFWCFVEEKLPEEFHAELHAALTGNTDLIAVPDKSFLTNMAEAAKGYWWWDPKKW